MGSKKINESKLINLFSWKSKEGEIIMTDQNHITNKYSIFLSKKLNLC